MGFAFFVLKKLFRRNAVIYLPVAVNVAVAAILVFVFFTFAFNFASATGALYAGDLSFYTVNVCPEEGISEEQAKEYAAMKGVQGCRVAYADVAYAEGPWDPVLPVTLCAGEIALSENAFAAGGMPKNDSEAAITRSLAAYLDMQPQEAVGLEFTLVTDGSRRACTVVGVLGEAECAGLSAALYSDVLVPCAGDEIACVTLFFTRDADISAALAALEEAGTDCLSAYRSLENLRAVYGVLSAVLFACGALLWLLFALGTRAAVEYTYKENILLWSLLKAFGGRTSVCFFVCLLLTALPVLVGVAAGIGLGALLLAGLHLSQFALWGVPFSLVSAFSAPALAVTAGAGAGVALLLALANTHEYARLDLSAALSYSE